MRQPRRTFSARRMFGAVSLLAIAAAAPAMAEQEAQSFEIPSQPLSEAIAEFARQANLDVIAPSALTRGKTSKPVAGEMEPQKALQLLMSDAALDVRRNDGGTLILVQAVTDVPKPQSSPTADPAPLPATPRDPAETADSQPTRATPLQRADRNDDEERTLGRVTVTGTLIRGLAPESSPLQIYTREDILGSGVTTTEQFIRTLPQNFGGGSTEFIRSLPNDANASSNTTSGTAVNLRGLGAGSTLTLLNGRRTAPSSAIGDFVDLSLIPLSAVSRIEVLSDGASSIYGGDAVAGVVNFVMRDDFEGSETQLRYGRVTEGELEEVRLSQTLGSSWGSGNLLGTYEYFTRDALSLSDRPGILPYNGTQNGAIPVDYFDLSPEQTRHSAVVSGRQQIGSRLVVSGLSLYTERSGRIVTVSTSGSIREADQKSKVLSLGLGAEYELSDSWSLHLDGTFSEVTEKNHSAFFTVENPSRRLSDLKTESSLWSLDARVAGKLLELPAGPAQIALGVHVRNEDFLSGIQGAAGSREGDREVRSVYAEAHVPLIGSSNARAGIERLEINLSGRADDYSDFGTTTNPKIGVLWAPVEALKLRGSYSTSFTPPTLGRVGALDRTGTVQRYGLVLQQFGATPADPSLLDMNILRTFGTASLDLEPETSTALTAGADLDFTLGGGRWSVSGSYYDIEYEGRLGRTPVPGNPPTTNLAPNLAFLNPSAFPLGAVIFNPTSEQVAAALATFSVSPTYLNGLTPADRIDIINNVELIRNLAVTSTRGIDLNLNYETETRLGRISAGLNANYILAFSRQAASTAPVVEELNTLYNPVDFQASGRIGLERGGFNGGLSLQYKDSYRTDGSESALPVGSWTTLDASFSYDFGQLTGVLRNVRAGVSVLNLLNTMPPRTPVFGSYNLPGYDPTNASPLGRFVAIDIHKSF